MKKIALLWFVCAGLLALNAFAGDEQRDMKGWGIDDPYNQYYDVKEYEKIRAWVVKLRESPPMPGMSPATIVDVRDGSEIIEVQMCPTWFAEPGEIGVKPGDRVKVKGVWAEINDKWVFMASKIKKDPQFEFKVRLTKNGKPFWTMGPEELAHERSESLRAQGIDN